MSNSRFYVVISSLNLHEDNRKRFTQWSSSPLPAESFRTVLLVSRSTPMPQVARASNGRGSSCLHGFEDRSDTLSSSDTHRDQRIPAAGAPEFIQRLHRQEAARRGNRVT